MTNPHTFNALWWQTAMCLLIATGLLSCSHENATRSDRHETKVDVKINLTMSDTTPKVTGIGGIFFKAENPKATNEWYAEKLGIAVGPHGAPFEFRNAHRPEEVNYLNWSVFNEKTDHFQPSEKQFMINYRVQHIDKLVENLRAAGVTICDEVTKYDYGKFVHIMDPEGNKIELWEPIDSVLTSYGGETTK